jgi:hypothetical protein
MKICIERSELCRIILQCGSDLFHATFVQLLEKHIVIQENFLHVTHDLDHFSVETFRMTLVMLPLSDHFGPLLIAGIDMFE